MHKYKYLICLYINTSTQCRLFKTS